VDLPLVFCLLYWQSDVEAKMSCACICLLPKSYVPLTISDVGSLPTAGLVQTEAGPP